MDSDEEAANLSVNLNDGIEEIVSIGFVSTLFFQKLNFYSYKDKMNFSQISVVRKKK